MNIRLYAQYADKPKAVAWYNILPTVASGIFDAAQAVRTSYSIDGNVQAQLDVIGRIVVMDQPWSTVQDDELYRLLIRSKIAKNNSDATTQSIIRAMSFIFPNDLIYINDNENMSFGVTFLNEITPEQIDIIRNYDVLPKPQGVRFRGYAVLPYITHWGRPSSQWGRATPGYYIQRA